jgi:hypothetical protein
MKEFIAGKAAFSELQKLVGSICEDTEKSNDVVIMLPQDDFAVREVRYTKENTILIGYPDNSGKYQAIPISNGNKFRVAIHFSSSSTGSTRRVTIFLDQS